MMDRNQEGPVSTLPVPMATKAASKKARRRPPAKTKKPAPRTRTTRRKKAVVTPPETSSEEEDDHDDGDAKAYQTSELAAPLKFEEGEGRPLHLSETSDEDSD